MGKKPAVGAAPRRGAGAGEDARHRCDGAGSERGDAEHRAAGHGRILRGFRAEFGGSVEGRDTDAGGSGSFRIGPSVPSRSRTADAARAAIPLLIAFAAPSSLVVERDRPSQFPILGNGPPGTFVLFPGRLRVSLPTDQVVSADDTGGYAKVGFGGMRFTGMTSGRLVFVRERDLYPVGQLSPDRSHTMRLEPQWVASIFAYGQLLWPAVPREP